MTLDFISKHFPAKDVTDGQYLYRSLGSFWTQVFKDKKVLQGYTTAFAEELIQQQYDLLKVLKQYSVKEIDLFSKVKWKPIQIKKSEFNKAPFIFQKDSAVFGRQPETDPFYADSLFRFGYPKETDGKSIFSFSPDFKLSKFGAIANRVISPSLLLLPGVNIVTSNNVLYFNVDLFNSEYIPKAAILNDLGEPVIYTDLEGKKHEDQLIILWMYLAEIDEQALYRNFGVLFDVKLDTSQAYKDMLAALMNLSVEGGTIAALSKAFAAISNAPMVIESSEIVEDIYTLGEHKYLITDKNTYRIKLTQEFIPEISLGARLESGKILIDNIKIADTVLSQNWWNKEIKANKLAFPSYVFAANIKYQLFFENDIRLITYYGEPAADAATYKINFPVLGRPKEVKAFQDYINKPDNKAALVAKLGLKLNKSLPINPMEFVFVNMFKNNTLLLKVDFYTEKQLNDFFLYLPLFIPYIPAHMHLLVYATLKLGADDISNLNNGLRIPGAGDRPFSLDGSVRTTGSRPVIPNEDGIDDKYFHDYINRLFCVSVGPYRNNGSTPGDPSWDSRKNTPVNLEPMHFYNNLDQLVINNSSIKDSSPGIKAGLLRTEIPLLVRPAGEPFPRPPTTREVQSILLIDF